MTKLAVQRCGPLTSIQDRGRTGWLRFGIPAAGAADPLAHAVANALVGNPLDTACIELVIGGGTFEAAGGAIRLALAGARMPLTVDGASIPDHTSFVLQPGSTLEIGSARTGVYAMLAVEGGFDIEPELGSRSLYARAGIGGLTGAYLCAGNILPLVQAVAAARSEVRADPVPLAVSSPLRAVLGPQHNHVSHAALETFFSSDYAVTSEVDRMGCRLCGPHIDHVAGFNIVSDGIANGSIQIPGSGQPIIMLTDRQTMGGYPKIATIITPDVRLLLQRRPGECVRFQTVTVEHAHEIARETAACTRRLLQSVRGNTAKTIRSEQLLEYNLAGDAVSALDLA